MTSDKDPFDGIVLPAASTIRAAMEAITLNAREVVMLRDDAGRIVGLITDGDIRRGLLRGCTQESPASEVMTREFVFVSPGTQRAGVLDLMKARTIRHVPVVDGDRRLVAIHFLQDLIGATRKPNRAIVMAGGRGTRLRPLTENLPKPMVQVAGRPILERIVLHLVGHGINHIYLAVNFMAEVIERHFADGAAFGCRIEYLREDRPLGTGGALSLLPEVPAEPLIALNGDQITDVDVSAMLEAHRASGSAATVGIGPYQVQVPFGTVVERQGRLVSLEEKPTINLLVNRGIYVIEPAMLKYVPKGVEFPITELLEKMLGMNHPVGAFYFDDAWIDVGRIDDLRLAQGLR